MRPGELIEAVKAVRIEGMLAKWRPQVQALQRDGVHVEVVLMMACETPAGHRIFDARETVRAEWDGIHGGDPHRLAAQTVRRLLAQAAYAIISECVLPGVVPSTGGR